jgi:hypothetical protein
VTLLMRVIFWVLLVALINNTAYTLADKEPGCRWMGWIWYVTAQLIMCFFMVLGWVLLIPFCVAHAWAIRPTFSIKDGRVIDQWKCRMLRFAYDNIEDGVSGQQALIGDATGKLVPYMPLSVDIRRPYPWWVYTTRAWLYDAWRAYCWSAWRNSCDALKYRFAWPNGPSATIFGKKVGWFDYYGRSLPVL